MLHAPHTRHGQGTPIAVRVGLTPDETLPQAHTSGLLEAYGHPEIILVGIMPEKARAGLATICRAIAAGHRFETPAILRGLLGDRPVAFAAVSPSSTARLLGEAVPGRTMQMCVPDGRGLFPWQDGCDPVVSDAQLGLLDLIATPEAETDRAPRLH